MNQPLSAALRGLRIETIIRGAYLQARGTARLMLYIARNVLLLSPEPIIDPSLCLLKEGVSSFRFGLESIGCSSDNKSAKRFAFEKLDDSPCLPIRSVSILLYFESDDVPAILVRL